MPEDTEGTSSGPGVGSSAIGSIIDGYFEQAAKAAGGGDGQTGDKPEGDDEEGAGGATVADGQCAKPEGGDAQAGDKKEGGGGEGDPEGTGKPDHGAYGDFELDTKPFEAITDPAQRAAATKAVQKRWAEQVEGLARKDAQRQKEHAAMLEQDRHKLVMLNAVLDPDKVEQVLPALLQEVVKVHDANGIDLGALLAGLFRAKQTKPLEDMTEEEMKAHFKAEAMRELRKENAAKAAEQQQSQGAAQQQAKDTEAWLESEEKLVIPLIAKLYDGYVATPEDVRKAYEAFPPARREQGMLQSVKAHLADKLLTHLAKGSQGQGKGPEMGGEGNGKAQKRPDYAKLDKPDLSFLG